jgi:ribosomal-protein-alanine N-acetyltransferase
MRSLSREPLVEPLRPGDVVAFAQCAAIDVTVFPNPSIPPLQGAPLLWIARPGREGPVSGFLAATRSGRVLEISGLAVAPDLRRRGVGRALLGAAVAHARAARWRAVALQVSTANTAALALYDAAGFARVRRLRRFYARWRFGDDGDAWAMMLPLP